MSKNKKRKKELLSKMKDNEKAKLTPKQEMFCHLYINNGMNGTKAAEGAGYTGNKNTLCVTGNKNLRKANVKSYINELMQEKYDRINMSGDELLMRSSMLARGNISNYFTKDDEGNTIVNIDPDDADAMYCIDEVTTKSIEGKVVETKIKLANREKSLRTVGDYKGVFKEKKELDITNNLKEALQGNELAAKLAFLLSSQETK